jgi:hypothetical protein
MGRHIAIWRMGFGFGVSVSSLVGRRIPSECFHRFTARFFINLRALAYHQRESVFANHAPPFAPPVLTHPLRNQLGRLLTNNFVHLEMDKAVYSSGTNPVDGNIVHADIIDLDVIDSQGSPATGMKEQE